MVGPISRHLTDRLQMVDDNISLVTSLVQHQNLSEHACAVCVRACVRACVRVCVRVCVCALVRTYVRSYNIMFQCVYVWHCASV